MAAVAPDIIVAQGPQNDNVLVPRTVIPLAAGFTAADPMLSVLVYDGAADYLLPDASPHDVEGAILTRTSFNDWYYRIHIIPQVINFGNLSGDQTVPVLVWNAFFDAVTLEDFSLTAVPGLSADEPITPPEDIGPLRTLTYAIEASTTGPAVISAEAVWTIDGVDYVVPISGRRSVLFSFRPNWKASPYRETYTWATTVNRTWSGQEQCMSITKAPRRSVAYSALVLDRLQKQILDSMLFGWQGRLYSLPLWNEATQVGAPVSAGSDVIQVDTTRMTIRDGATVVLFLRAGVHEALEVESYTASTITVTSAIAANWPLGTRVLPAVPAIPAPTISSSRPVPERAAFPISFTVDPASRMNRVRSSTAGALYRGEEAYYVETDWAVDLDVPFEANRRDTDGGLGVIAIIPKGDFPTTGRSFRWVCKNRAVADTLFDFFCRRKGRAVPTWMPSGLADFELVAPIDVADSTIVVRNNEYNSFIAEQEIRRDIVLLMRDGRRLARRIIDSAPTGDTLVLTLDSVFGEAISLSQVKRISYLGLYRQSSDSVTFNWITDQVCTVEMDFVLKEPAA